MFNTRRVRCHCCRAQISVYAPICYICGSKDPADPSPESRKRPWRQLLTRIPGLSAIERDPVGYGEVYYSQHASRAALRHYGSYVRQRQIARLEPHRQFAKRIPSAPTRALTGDGGVMV